MGLFKTIKNIGRGVIPTSIFKALQPLYHGMNALIATVYYARPSEKMIIVGVTGTAGKSTTINALAHILNRTGHKTGFITTTNYNNGRAEVLNKHGVSMPGGWLLQQQLREIANNGCRYAIVECTSEGLAQNRHLGINFDMALLTNLTPAHLETHGGFENYRAAKARLFIALNASNKKKLFEQKIIGVNLDDDNADYFLQFKSEKKFGITFSDQQSNDYSTDQTYSATLVTSEPQVCFSMGDIQFNNALIGKFNAYNLALAVAAANVLGTGLNQSAEALKSFIGVPGRMEKIANTRGITIIVDFACEPQPMISCLASVSKLPHNKLIHVFGSTGGARDISKRFSFGQSSARVADTMIITNDDVYESNPTEIADQIKQGAERLPAAEHHVQKIITTLDRRQAIREALQLAQEGDIVLVTGKGSEQFLSLPGNKRIEWDDRTVVQEELTRL